MQDKLKAAFSAKERAETFLSNLEKLKEEKSIGDAQYRVLKIEYTQMREDATSKVNAIKAYAKKELDDKVSRLNVLEQELAYLEARFKVGQMSASTYLYKEKGPRRKLVALEKQNAELRALLDSSGSAQIVVPESGLKILGVNLGLSRKQSQEQDKPVATEEKKAEQISEPVVSTQPQAQPQVPDQPLSPPPPPPAPILVSTTDLQIMPDRFVEGGTVGIIVVVTNITNGNVQQDIELKVNGVVKDSRQLSLVPGESNELTFVQVVEKPGDYEVDINGVTGKFSVVPAETIRYLR